MEENIIDTTDRILMLPEFIVHHILSYLLDDPRSCVRMSVLSKGWFALTASFPILSFRQARLQHLCSDYYDRERIMEKFRKYVEYTLSRFCKQNISAHTLEISADLMNLEQVEFFGYCLDLVFEKGLQVIDIQFDYHPRSMPMLRLPDTLLSASSLTSLRLYQCELPSSLMVGAVKFKSLRLLSLSYLPIEEGVIEFLTESCPVLEEFFLNSCYGFKTFRVKRHHNLQKVEIYSGSRLERIDVDAPNLSYFLLESNKDKAPTLFMGSCKKLTTFCYSGFPLKRLNDFLSNFPFIENLYLDLSSRINNLKLSNQFLTTLQLYADCDLEEFDLYTPSLLLFEYWDEFNDSIVASLLKKESSLLNGRMKWSTAGPLDILWYQKLRKFLEKNSIFKDLKLDIYSKLIDVEDLKSIQSSPYKLEHVELKHKWRQYKPPAYIAFVDAVLWCCRPRSLTLVLYHFNDTSHVVKYTYEKLLQQEDEGQTNIKLVLISPSKEEQHFSDLNSLLQRLYISLDQVKGKLYFGGLKSKITFIKEEVVQEAG